MPRLERPDPGTPITAEWARALVDTINGLLQGPDVVAPLARKDGVVYLAQDYQLYAAKTTGTIPARSGTAWNKGPAKFLTVDAAGVESDAGGFPAFDAWNWTATAFTASGLRIWVAWSYDRWVIVNGECASSGGG